MNLCTLAQVKQFLGITDNSSDSILQSMITSYSSMAERFCGRSFAVQTYNEFRDGNSGERLMLRNWPVISISSVMSWNTNIPASGSVTNAGYRNVDSAEVGDGRMLVLQGYSFDKGKGNVQVQYSAGYANGQITDEQWNIPATPGPYTITLLTNTLFIAGTDSVKYVSGGAPLTRVAGNPNAGQYSITSDGGLTFNAADQGAGIYASYQTLNVPFDLSQAALELCSLRYKSRDWLGYKSKSLAGETVTFETEYMPQRIQNMLVAFRNTFITP